MEELGEKSTTSNRDWDNYSIGIAVSTILLAATMFLIVKLVTCIVKLHKKLRQVKSKEL